MRLKGKAKEILGLMRAKIFGITAGQSVYIGKHCSLKGKHHITLEDCVTVRPYAQIWSGGVQLELAKAPKLVNDAESLLLILWKLEKKYSFLQTCT